MLACVTQGTEVEVLVVPAPSATDPVPVPPVPLRFRGWPPVLVEGDTLSAPIAVVPILRATGGAPEPAA